MEILAVDATTMPSRSSSSVTQTLTQQANEKMYEQV